MEYEQNTKELETNVPESEDIDDANIESFQPKKQNEKNKKNLSLRWSKRQPTKKRIIRTIYGVEEFILNFPEFNTDDGETHHNIGNGYCSTY